MLSIQVDVSSIDIVSCKIILYIVTIYAPDYTSCDVFEQFFELISFRHEMLCFWVIFNFMDILYFKQFNTVENVTGHTLDLVLSNINGSVNENGELLVDKDVYHPTLLVEINYSPPTYNQFKIKKDLPKCYNFQKADFQLTSHPFTSVKKLTRRL